MAICSTEQIEFFTKLLGTAERLGLRAIFQMMLLNCNWHTEKFPAVNQGVI
jgi:hypothetical protein